MAAYNSLVPFEGWDHFWRDAAAASPAAHALCGRLDLLLEPVRGYRLQASDFAHGDLHLTNVLVDGGAITGVVDWDELRLNSRPPISRRVTRRLLDTIEGRR
jgi:aminoglycoside phosphotransferase (APT) family kinase protein